MRVRRAVLTCLALAGCAGRAAVADSEVATSAAVVAKSEPVSAPPPDATPPAAAVVGEAWGPTLPRATLDAVVAEGLPRTLARLGLSAVMEGRRFAGFRVTKLAPEWRACGLLEGDVVLRLNGQSVERPELALRAFESLRIASEVSVDLVRDGQPLRLRYQVE